MKDKTLLLAASGVALLAACGGQEQMPTFDAPQTTLTTIGNPYIPLWDHIPDGESYVFEDPDNPGKNEPKAFAKAQTLIEELKEHPRTGTGHPEQLSGDRAGQWSRRITQNTSACVRNQ